MLCAFVWQKLKTFYQMNPMQLLHCKSQCLKFSVQTVPRNMQNVWRKILDDLRQALNAKIKMTNKILLLNRLMKRNCWNYKSWAYHLPFVLMYAVPGRKSKQHKELPGQILMVHSTISTSFPSHCVPLFFGVGLLQARLRTLNPESQVFEHSSYEDQVLHPPCTKNH